MKTEKLVIVLLVFSLFFSGCNNLVGIRKNQLIVENLENNILSSHENSKNKKLTEEEAKLKSLELLEKYLNIKLYLTEVKCYINFKDGSEIEIKSNREKVDKSFISKFENSNSVFENGIFSIYYTSRKDDIKQEFTGSINIEINAKTGELLSLNLYNFSSSKAFSGIGTIEESEKVAKEFIEKNNIGNIKNAKLIEKHKSVFSKNKYIVYKFTFQDSKDSNKKVFISMNGKNISSISIGIMNYIYD
ncbi:hypothetical protein ACFIJ5_08790 [Haloimpatiens sp. FM7330]|uniref:hypothetical protein n=1 Tax=Haloimpatiens sp. FM7330 TaxID=3298610 RepID=UPI00364329D2